MHRIITAFKSKTVYQSIITSGSIVINGILGVVFYILVARILGPVDFGVLSVALITLSLVSDLASVGTDTGIVKFVGQHIATDRLKALGFLKLGFKIKLIIGVIVLIFGFLITPFIAESILAKPTLVDPLRYALLGALGMLLFSFATSALQALQKFWQWGLVNISANLVRLLLVLILIGLGRLTLTSGLVVYITCIFLGFFIALYSLPNFFKVKEETRLRKEFLDYNKWVALFVVFAAFSGRLDTYLTTKLLSLAEVGVYSVAVSLSAIGAQLVTGITTVVAPKLAGFDSLGKAKTYLVKLQIFTSLLAILIVLVGIPLGGVVIPLLYGQAYLNSLAPLGVLIIAQAVFLLSVPAHASVFYYFSQPKLFVYTSFVNLLIVFCGGWLFISRFGYIGAALTVLVGNIINLVIPGVWVIRKFHHKD